MKYIKKVAYEIERYPVSCQECPAFKQKPYACHCEKGMEADCELGYMKGKDMRDFSGHTIYSSCRIKMDNRVTLMNRNEEKTVTEKVLKEEYQVLREKYQIPETKVLPDLLAEQDPEWAERLKKIWWQKENLKELAKLEIPESEKSKYVIYKKMNEIMLTIGGSETCIATFDPDFIKLLERGYYRNGESELVKGLPSRCHSNVAKIYDECAKDGNVIICTGFALSEDCMWRQHSWLLQKYMTKKGYETRILETTAKRVAYFGFELTSEEANEFVELNY